MRYGMCIQNTQLDFIPAVAKMGYDYIECRFNLFTRESEELVAKMHAMLKETGIPCESCNCFMPGDLKVTGTEIDEVAIRAYVEKGMKALAEIGCKVVVFGSGGSRNIPEDFGRAEGVKQIEKFLGTIAGPIAEQYGITVVIEPLCKKDSNVLNTVHEAVVVAEAVNHPAVSSLADLYHMAAEEESAESLAEFVGKVKHCHIAAPGTRAYPAIGDEYDYNRFLSVMEKVGCPRCSVEGSTKEFIKDAQKSMDLFNTLK